MKQKQPAFSADDPSQPTAAMPVAPTEHSASAAPARDSEEVALPAASHVPLVPALEELSSAAGPAKQQAAADKPTAASSQVLLATIAVHADKQATPKPPEDVKAETEVSGVAAEASCSTPAAPIPSEAGGCASKEDARPASAAAAHVSSAAGAEATVLSPPPAKDVLGAGVTSAPDTVLASGTQAVTSPSLPPLTRAMSLRERLKASRILSPISLRLESYDVAAMSLRNMLPHPAARKFLGSWDQSSGHEKLFFPLSYHNTEAKMAASESSVRASKDLISLDSAASSADFINGSSNSEPEDGGLLSDFDYESDDNAN
nr:nematocyst expressed protein 3-like [Dermacentor andersoni]